LVVLPRDAEDVAHLASRGAQEGLPITSRGAGTNIAGNAIGPCVVVDFSRHMTRVLDLDPETRTAVVQPGTVLDTLRRQASGHDLTFGVDPSTHNGCTLGGMIGTNACGSHSVASGTTADNVDTIDVVPAGGSSATLGRRAHAVRSLDGASPSLTEPLTAVARAYRPEIRRELHYDVSRTCAEQSFLPHWTNTPMGRPSSLTVSPVASRWNRSAAGSSSTWPSCCVRDWCRHQECRTNTGEDRRVGVIHQVRSEALPTSSQAFAGGSGAPDG